MYTIFFKNNYIRMSTHIKIIKNYDKTLRKENYNGRYTNIAS